MIKLNGVLINPTIFPDKTSQVWKLPKNLLEKVYKDNYCRIEWTFEAEAELIHVAQLKTLLDTYTDNIVLDIPYLPYARQDKRIDNEATFALRTFASILNGMNFTSVHVIDSHNNARANLINNLEDLSPRDFIISAIDKTKVDLVLMPDAGAATRYGTYFSKEGIYSGAVKTAVATKDRDPLTGYIKNVQIQGTVKDNNILIIDDICDGGMTFKLVAEAALKAGAKKIHLYVTHGIFSKGLETLRDSGINRIFTYKGELGRISDAALRAELTR